MKLDLEAFKKAEEIYNQSSLVCCYDEEYFWRAIETYLEHANNQILPAEGSVSDFYPSQNPVETDHEGRPITYWGGKATKASEE
jgi:hypothetical protein